MSIKNFESGPSEFIKSPYFKYFIKGVRANELSGYAEYYKIKDRYGQEAAHLFNKGMRYASNREFCKKKFNENLYILKREMDSKKLIYLSDDDMHTTKTSMNDSMWKYFNFIRCKRIFEQYPQGGVRIEIKDSRCSGKNRNIGMLLEKDKADNEYCPSYVLLENNRRQTKSTVKHGHKLIGTEMCINACMINIIKE